MVELYQRLRDSLWGGDEPAFRRAFEPVFGDRMAAFPAPLPDAGRERLWAEGLRESPRTTASPIEVQSGHAGPIAAASQPPSWGERDGSQDTRDAAAAVADGARTPPPGVR